MNINKYIIGLLFMGILACRKQDHYYKEFVKDGEKIYAGKIKSLRAHSGPDRIVLSGLLPTDLNIRQVEVFWNDRVNSLVFDVPKESIGDSVSVTIAPLAEGTYLFQVYSLDVNGNRSIKTEVEGKVYREE